MFRLYWKIFLWFWLMLVLTVVSVSWVSISLTKKSFVTNREKELLQAFTLAAVTVLENGGEEALFKWTDQLKKSFNIKVFLVNVNTGELLGPQVKQVKQSKDIKKDINKDIKKVESEVSKESKTSQNIQSNSNSNSNTANSSVFDQNILHNPDLIVRANFTTRAGTEYMLIFVQGSGENIISKIYSKNLLIDLVILFIVLSIISYIVSRHLVRPLFKLRKAIQLFASGNLSARPPKDLLKRKDEIGILAVEFANMASKIQVLIENSKQLLQDVSHELRSPLARLNIASSLIQQVVDKASMPVTVSNKIDKMIVRIDCECEKLNDMIAEILSYFRMQMQEDSVVTGEMDLVGLLEDLIKSVSYENQVSSNKIRLNLQNVENNFYYVGQAKLLHRAFENILRNAMKYTDDYRVDIWLGYDSESKIYVLEFRDYGPGVPEHMLDRLFDPFFRVHTDRSQQQGGYGLGLSIAQRAVEMHSGKITAMRYPAGGLVVRVELPDNVGDE